MSEYFFLSLDLALLGEAKSPAYNLPVFAMAAIMYGMLIVVLDCLTTKVTNSSSHLKLSYVGYKAILVIITWGLGAGIGALVGAAFGIFEISRTAAIFAGVAWPLVLPRLISSANSDLSKEKVPLEATE
ncbi:TPA: hypothetical protein NJ324_001280 [Vibrio parahaemolyticus]|uniref:hypothetical protein n=1 Tax=Vibrio parahaemolyticus TaxID=670 RepID=UPI00046EB1FD|nr:hypothetical protein [Vibrio parahaemolyticus]AYF19698.1 hypothetical protein FORC71_1326 [Vibrio parahaemolyticus]EHK9063541.1 hypothetical protein [Vibrio parahaemolyticus]EIE7520900.1 hypothetical protein [Vibrio parahaemolyticus]MBC8664130.1 hypothetical protein [Vibrio parahaemolyticus]MBM5089425.1 hypothetical protein [Vibrio parahaemolyticus]